MEDFKSLPKTEQAMVQQLPEYQGVSQCSVKKVEYVVNGRLIVAIVKGEPGLRPASVFTFLTA